MMGPRAWTVVSGDGAQMDLLRTGEADLVLTGPPYFDDAVTKPMLQAPARGQRAWSTVYDQVRATAASFRGVFVEIARVLRPGGAAVIQTKDLRYGGGLIPLASWHRELAEQAGLRLVTRVYWRKLFDWRTSAMEFRRTRTVGSFRADDVEEFQVFSHPVGLDRRGPVPDLCPEDVGALASPLWTLRSPGGAHTHPYQAPADVLRRLLDLFSLPGDLVVDPFAGHATTLRLAIQSGRRAVGYELDLARAEACRAFLRRTELRLRRRARAQEGEA